MKCNFLYSRPYAFGFLILIGILLEGGVRCSLPAVSGISGRSTTLIVEAPLTERIPLLQGQIVYDLPNGKLWALPLDAKSEAAPLFRLPPRTFAFQPVWSPVAQKLAYGYIQPDATSGQLMSAKLWIASIDGSGRKSVTQPGEDFAGTYRDPAWAPDGKTLWATVQLPVENAAGTTLFRSEIRRIDLATGTEVVIVRDAHGPALSPDRQRFAYLVEDAESGAKEIWQANTDGANAQILVAKGRFEEVYAPMRYSPDGQTLAFAAAASADQRSRSSSTGSGQNTLLRKLTALVGPSAASAHGLIPADVWLVQVNTGVVEQLTQLSEDHPTPVWSPDGRHLAFAGVSGIYVVDVVERSAIRLTDRALEGQIEWIKESRVHTR